MSDRDAYVEKFQAKLEQWNAEIDRLEGRMKEANADAKIELQKHLDEARSRRDEARQKLKELRGASADAWEDIKGGAEQAWQACRDAVERATAKFK